MAKLCPHCKGTSFKSLITRGGTLDFSGDAPAITQEGQKFQYEIKQCTGCNTAVTEAELIEARKCDATGVLTPLTELRELNGRHLSSAAYALESRTELQGLSQLDLIAKLLELEARVVPTTKSTPAPVQEAKQELVTTSEQVSEATVEA